MNKRLFILLGRTGDIIGFLPVMFAHHQRGQPAALMVAKQYASVLEGCSYLTPIIFDGEPHELERAFDEAKKISPDVCCVQTAGPPDLIKKYSFEPTGTAHATTDSFSKESWKLAGSMALWKENIPIVFDQRNLERESELVKAVLGKVGKATIRPILVSTSGISSPFSPADLLLELVKLHARRHPNSVVDLNAVRAERFYDLLGLYERSRCLISTDSAPLHLAQACPNLPVLAIVNDKPSYWHGAAWRRNHVFHCRYSDWPQRAVEMLNVIEHLDTPGSWSCRSKKNPRIIHVFSTHEGAGNPHWDTWANHYDNHKWISFPIATGTFGRDSKQALKSELRQPFIKDMIRAAALRADDSDLICLTRPDIGFVHDLTSNLFKNAPCFAHRSILDGDLTYHPSTDLFAFSKKFWREHEKELPDMILGTDVYWHRCIKAWMLKNGGQEIPFAVYRDNSKLIKSSTISVYNETLSKKWFGENKISLALPKVSEQIETIRINPKAISAYGYNPAIAKRKDGYLMAYRWHFNETSATSLAIAELDSGFNVTRNRPITLPGASVEDMRFFEFKGEIWCSYVESNFPKQATSTVRYGQLVETGSGWRVEGQWQVQHGENDGLHMEKNWVFFSLNGKLFCLYQSSPEQIVIEIEGFKVVNEWKTSVEHWKWGERKGGTISKWKPGTLLRFFHSTLDNEPSPYKRRYYLGAMSMADSPPFQSKLISEKPIVKGSENDDLPLPDRLDCAHRKPQVVFPAGCIRHEDGWLLSCGVNDCASVILKIKENDL